MADDDFTRQCAHCESRGRAYDATTVRYCNFEGRFLCARCANVWTRDELFDNDTNDTEVHDVTRTG